MVLMPSQPFRSYQDGEREREISGLEREGERYIRVRERERSGLEREGERYIKVREREREIRARERGREIYQG